MTHSIPTTKSENTQSELAAWLALMRLPGMGPITFRKLNQQFPYLNSLFVESKQSLLSQGCSEQLIQRIQSPDWQAVETDLAWLQQQPYHYIVLLKDKAYPEPLQQLPDAPPVLFVKGCIEVLQTHQLAIVGSRKPSLSGAQIAREFAETLAQSGLTITSGLALGIDAAAHRGAMLGGGATIAVLGCGLDQIYPRSHRDLAASIIEAGALVSEFPIKTPPLAEHFPRRNRIVSGLSLGTLVVEAAAVSGSLITARLANEQGREVFAIPGSIYNGQAKGCNLLIQQGAKLVTEPCEILDEFPHLTPKSEPADPISTDSPAVGLDEHQLKLLECIATYEPTAFDLLQLRSGLEPNLLASCLLKLEIAGLLSLTPGGYTRTV